MALAELAGGDISIERCRCLPSWAIGRGTPAQRPERLAAARRLNCWRSMGWVLMARSEVGAEKG
jgi:hypothetical protein